MEGQGREGTEMKGEAMNGKGRAGNQWKRKGGGRGMTEKLRKGKGRNDSKPEKEYAETINKAKALMKAVD